MLLGYKHSKNAIRCILVCDFTVKRNYLSFGSTYLHSEVICPVAMLNKYMNEFSEQLKCFLSHLGSFTVLPVIHITKNSRHQNFFSAHSQSNLILTKVFPRCHCFSFLSLVLLRYFPSLCVELAG